MDIPETLFAELPFPTRRSWRSTHTPSCGACPAPGEQRCAARSLARCALAGATAPREARVHTQDEACPLAGGVRPPTWRAHGCGRGGQCPVAKQEVSHF